MNEFEWRLQLRSLCQPLAPRQDLWAGIESSLDADGGHDTAANLPLRHHRRWLLGAGLAASLLLAAGIGWQVTRAPAARATSQVAATTARWEPADPRLSGAAIELDAARMELQLALHQAPDSAALQRLLGRTEQQQNQLRRLASQPG